MLTGAIRSVDQLDAADFRRLNPRSTGKNFEANLVSLKEVEAVARELERHPHRWPWLGSSRRAMRSP
jgi:hypothetical protein